RLIAEIGRAGAAGLRDRAAVRDRAGIAVAVPAEQVIAGDVDVAAAVVRECRAVAERDALRAAVDRTGVGDRAGLKDVRTAAVADRQRGTAGNRETRTGDECVVPLQRTGDRDAVERDRATVERERPADTDR